MLLFAASTSRQLRAVSEGPRRKGKGAKDYYTWLEANYSKAFYVGESRASGGRQDLEFEASVAVYVNRPHYAKFLDVILPDPQHRNILETSARPRRAFRGKKTTSSSTITSLNPDGSGRTESRFRVPTRAPRDRRSLGARLDDGKIPGFQCRPLPLVPGVPFVATSPYPRKYDAF